MKRRVYDNKRRLLLSLLLIAAASFSLSAEDARKEYTKTFNVSKGINLSVDTKYSDIEVLTWDRNVLDVLIEVKVDAASKNRAEEILKGIDVSIQKTGNTISCVTEIQQKSWGKNLKLDIRYTIKLPAYLNVDINNKYGDLFIQEISGLVLLDLQYGNLKAGKFSRGNEKPHNKLDLAYSNGTIDQAGYVELDLAYSEMEIFHSDMLVVESKYSKLIGDQVGTVITEGAYDKYVFDAVDEFVAELKYSNLKFGKLNNKLDLQSSYTNASIGSVDKAFDEINASLSYGNIRLGVEPGTAFKFEGESKYGKISVAPEGKLSKSKEGSSMKIWGTVGSSPKAFIHLIVKYGNISVE